MDNRKEFIEESPKLGNLMEEKQKQYINSLLNENNNDLIQFISVNINLLQISKQYLAYEYSEYKNIIDKKHQEYIIDQLGSFFWMTSIASWSSYEIFINKLFEVNYSNTFVKSRKYNDIVKKYPDLQKHQIFSDKNYKILFSYDLITKINKLYNIFEKDFKKEKIQNIQTIYKRRNTIHTGESTLYDTINKGVNEFLEDIDNLITSGNELFHKYNHNHE